MKTIFTIGHSRHKIEHFIALLQSMDVKMLADIRSMPGSQRYPQFNSDALKTALTGSGIGYTHLPELGGKPTGTQGVPFAGYIAHIQTGEFARGIALLEQMATGQNVAYMCAEALWWNCHRSLVSDHLAGRGWQVVHIMGMGRTMRHHGTAASKPKQGSLF